MGLLNRLLLIAGLGLPVAAGADEARPLLDYDFSAYAQGRLTAFMNTAAKPAGALNTDPYPQLAGGEYSTQVLLKRLEFQLSTPLPLPGTLISATAAAHEDESIIQEAYAQMQLGPESKVRLGLFRVPFGLEPQTSSRFLDTVERALIYHFGNFSWVAPLGMGFVGERDMGLRLDLQGSGSFAGFSPCFQMAGVTGNGQNVRPGLPTQIMGRLGVSSALEMETLRHRLDLGLSGSWGWNKLKLPAERYLPIGAAGDLNSNPEAVVTAPALDSRSQISVLGADIFFRANMLVIKAEWVSRRLAGFWSQGYYITASAELLGEIGIPLDLVGRWEEAWQGYPDGAHTPNTKYQVATAGVNWNLNPAWRVQLNYIVVLQEMRLDDFNGSDLLIAQLQCVF